ncbi:DUF1653 domain-containing protein, partial [Candidatus Saccharibacteria bacterium]|nr:DUF1653 domain-containing protein [Candidatus Saccharibacteria bacterium]
MKKLEQGRLDNMIAEAAGKVEIGGRYLHYKGNIYRVLDIVISESSQTLLVVYQAEYGRRLKFARDLDDWLEE